MRRLGLTELDAFVVVGQRLSFAKAATQLGLSRSALSEMIRGLEERIGVRLFNRTTRSVSLTEAGEQFLRRVQPVLDDVTAALDAVTTFRDRPSGTLRLTVAPPAVTMLIEPILTPFLKAYPDINVEISADSGLVNIVTERFDAGIRVGELIDRDMIAVRLAGHINPVLVAAPSYLKRNGVPERPEDLQQHNCIRLRFASGALLPWVFFGRDDKTFEVAVRGNLIVNTLELALRAALDGVGIVPMVRHDVAALIKQRRLVTVLESWVRPGAEFSLYYSSRRQMPVALQTFIAFLRAEGLLTGGRRPR